MSCWEETFYPSTEINVIILNHYVLSYCIITVGCCESVSG